jgi:hypothetical protein
MRNAPLYLFDKYRLFVYRASFKGEGFCTWEVVAAWIFADSEAS